MFSKQTTLFSQQVMPSSAECTKLKSENKDKDKDKEDSNWVKHKQRQRTFKKEAPN